MGHDVQVAAMIRKTGAKRIAEVGVWKGKLMRAVLRQLDAEIDRYYAVDQWRTLDASHGHMGGMDQGEWDALAARCYLDMQWFNSLRVVRMPSIQAASILPRCSLDLVYLDGSHFFDDVVSDIRSWLPTVRNGGFIGGHDYGTGARKGHRVKDAVAHALPGEAIQIDDGVVWWMQVRS